MFARTAEAVVRTAPTIAIVVTNMHTPEEDAARRRGAGMEVDLA
jgi:hypothetical protein